MIRSLFFKSKLALTFALALFLTSCQQTDHDLACNLVDVTVTLSSLDITTTPLSRASDKTASEAKVTNIALIVLDNSGNTVATVAQTSTDEGFGTISIKLPVGSYTFVAVANDQNASSDITSATLATSPENVIIYSCVKSVTISGNTTQGVTLDMGKRKTSAFKVKITDTTPDDVDAIQFIISPSASSPTFLTFSPTTGLAPSTWKYEKTYAKAAYNLTTFTNKTVAYNFLLTAAETQLDVTINALSSEDPTTHQRTTLYTRTLTGVTFRQACSTTATGTFFSATSSASFLFDTTLDNNNISLD